MAWIQLGGIFLGVLFVAFLAGHLLSFIGRLLGAADSPVNMQSANIDCLIADGYGPGVADLVRSGFSVGGLDASTERAMRNYNLLPLTPSIKTELSQRLSELS